MFCRSTRQSPFWPAAALLVLLAAAYTLLAQDAPSTVQADVVNRTEKDIEFTLVGPDGKALGAARTVKPGYVYRTNPRTLPKGSAKGYTWVLRDPATKKVLKTSPATGRITIVEGVFRAGAGELPRESRLAFVTNRTAKPIEFALVGPDGKDLGPARSVEPGKEPYRTSERTLPKGSAKGYNWVVRDPATKKVLQRVPAEWSMQSIVVDSGKGIGATGGVDTGKRLGIRAGEVTLKSGKDTIKGYLAVPEGTGPFPGVVVIQEWYGLTDWIKDNARRLANDGYVCLAPDLYRGRVAKDDDAAEQMMHGLPNDRALRDLRGAVDFLAKNDKVNRGKIGVIGWCLGGKLALHLSLADQRVVACATCYGHLDDFRDADSNRLNSLNATVLGIYGTRDEGIPSEFRRTFSNALKKKGKLYENFKEYDAGHGFMRDVKGDKAYNAKEAKRAWGEIDRFFAKELKGK
jgi:carboxymethylenebutenolidase